MRPRSDVRPPIFCREAGSGPPLVLIHGGLCDGEGAWSQQLVSLTPYHRLLVVDRRGHGRSPREPRPYTIAGDAADVLEAAGRAGATAFHLAGHSYGGLVAIEVARQAPGRVLSLHLVEPPYLQLLPDDPDVRSLIGRSRTITARAAAWGPERTALEFFTMLMGPEAARDLPTRPAWPHLVREAGRIAHEEPAASYPAEAVIALAPRGPVQVYIGGQSHPGLGKLGRRLHEMVPGAALLEVPQASHAVQLAGSAFDVRLLAVTRSRPRL